VGDSEWASGRPEPRSRSEKSEQAPIVDKVPTSRSFLTSACAGSLRISCINSCLRERAFKHRPTYHATEEMAYGRGLHR